MSREGAPPTGLEADVGGAENAQGQGAEEQENRITQSGGATNTPPIIAWTLFKGTFLTEGELKRSSWQDFCKMLAEVPAYKNKKEQPLLKLGVYRDNSRAQHSPLLEISGIEIDYDAGKVSQEDAAARIKAAGIEAFLCSTYTATDDTPKWRAFLPLAGCVGAEHRAAWVAAADGVLGCIAARESYTSKQAFYFGRRDDSYQINHCQGAYLNTLPAMQTAADKYAAALHQNAGSPRGMRYQDTPPPRQDQQWDDTRDALQFLSAADQGTWVDVGLCLAGTFGESGWTLFDEWSLTAPAHYEANENRTRWLSFFPSTKTVASIFQLAAENGWQNPAKRQPTSGNQQQGNAQRANAVKNDTEHPIPQPLPPDLPPVLPFDYDYLPDSLGAWVQDVALRMSAPPDFIVSCLLVELGAVIGRKVAIRPQENTDWEIVPNLWGMMVGRPSMMKSPSLSAAMIPIQRLEAAATRIYEEQMGSYSYQAQIAKLELEVATKNAKSTINKAGVGKGSVSAKDLQIEEPDKPVLKRYSTNSFTEAALTAVLQENPNGLLGVRDEFMGLLKSLDSEGNSGLRELILESWNGKGQYITDRITRGMAMKVSGLCLSMIGGTQPGKISSYLTSAIKGGVGDDGLVQRFGLLVWPDPVEYKEHDEPPDKPLTAELHRIFKRLDELTPEHVGAQQDVDDQGEPDGLPYLRFDYEAMTQFRDWRGELMNRIRGDDIHPAMESHLMKYTKLVPALALIFHLVEVERGAVGADSLVRALAMAEYLETHAARAYASVTMGKVVGAKTLLAKIKAQKLGNPFRARDITKAGWTGFDKETTDEALDLLVDYGWLEEHESDTSKGGRPTTEYYLNPLAEGLL